MFRIPKGRLPCFLSLVLATSLPLKRCKLALNSNFTYFLPKHLKHTGSHNPKIGFAGPPSWSVPPFFFGGGHTASLEELSVQRVHTLLLCSAPHDILGAYLQRSGGSYCQQQWTIRMSSPDVAFLHAVLGEVALVVEPLPLRGVGRVRVGPGQLVAGGVVLVEERLKHGQVVRALVAGHEVRLLGVEVALFDNNMIDSQFR